MIAVSLFHTSESTPQLLLLTDDLENLYSWSFAGGAKGLLLYGKHLLVAYKITTGECFIAVIDIVTKHILSSIRLSEVNDIHSLCILENELYVVSSGTNRIEVYDLTHILAGTTAVTSKRAIIVDPMITSSVDEMHLNSLCIVRGELYASAFGRRPVGAKWAEATHGYVKNVTLNTKTYGNIPHPHSLLNHADEVWYCSSAEGKIYKNGEAVYSIPGYLRGLSITPSNALFAATSSNRIYNEQSRDSSKIYKIENVLTQGNTPQHTIELNDPYAEVYDIEYIPDTLVT